MDSASTGDEDAPDAAGDASGAPSDDSAAGPGGDAAGGPDVPAPPTCDNAVRDPGETDVDCGGACGGCATGKTCDGDADCLSAVCRFGLCRDPSCTDGLANQGETDVDCGGPCAKCALGRGCATPADCESGYCAAGQCGVPDASCDDNLKNGAETDVDCGPGCAPCPTGKTCVEGNDCLSETCVFGLCRDPTCSDGLKNGKESDVDCGGGGCPKCADGDVCSGAADCASAQCATFGINPATGAPVGMCISCADGKKNGDEASIDCGGSCKACDIGASCTTNADCASGTCAAGHCASCSDGQKNQSETDVDCGGPCGACGEGGACKSDADCGALLCLSKKCTPRFLNPGDGTIVDHATGLRWLAYYPYGPVGSGKQMPIGSAKTTCANLVEAGISSWRLPTLLEIRTRIDPSKCPTMAADGTCPLGKSCWDASNVCKTSACTCGGGNAGCVFFKELGGLCSTVWSADPVQTGVGHYWAISGSGTTWNEPSGSDLAIFCVTND